jgi:aminoglycoside phosphotransferase (APT) family kinase protein
MPGLAATLHTADGDRAFIKAIPDGSPAARLYERERWAGTVLPPTVPTPRMTWSSTVDGWITMLFEHIDGRRADLSPGSPDVPVVFNTVAQLGSLLTPCSAVGAPPVADNVGLLQAKGRHLLAKPVGVLPHRDMYAAALGAFDLDALAGDTLLHYDLHTGNLQVTEERLYVIDWGFAAQGSAWVDAAMLAPRLIEAGHTPAQAEELLSALPAWTAAPEAAVTGLAALWTLFRVYKAMYGPEDGREFRSRAADAGRAWVAYRTT